jgi:hypothetical protein
LKNRCDDRQMRSRQTPADEIRRQLTIAES